MKKSVATVRLRINGVEYTGEGESRLEAFALAVNEAAPALREVLQRTRAKGPVGGRTSQRQLAQRSARAGQRPTSLERGRR